MAGSLTGADNGYLFCGGAGDTGGLRSTCIRSTYVREGILQRNDCPP